MNKLTLPIEAGKKYVRRDGTVEEMAGEGDDRITNLAGTAGWVIETGRYFRAGEHRTDLIADYIEEVAPVTKSHVHAASMLLYAQDAMETDKPWLRWTLSIGGFTYGCEKNPSWAEVNTYQRKF